jgi:hypothetical protein
MLQPAHHSFVHFPVIAPVASWIQPVLDANDRLHHLIIAVGGDYPKTYRLTTSARGQSWREIVARFDEALDNLADVSDGTVFAGPLRAVPVGNDVALLRTSYVAGSSAATVTIAAVSVLYRDSLHTAKSIVDAARVRVAAGNSDPLTADEFRARVAELHQEMNTALRRGDFAAFGDAFNRLGRLLARPRR